MISGSSQWATEMFSVNREPRRYTAGEVPNAAIFTIDGSAGVTKKASFKTMMTPRVHDELHPRTATSQVFARAPRRQRRPEAF
jgi:hypothetical protein